MLESNDNDKILIEGLSRKEFRKNVVKNEGIFENLVIRIREDKDLIYYNGNKAFEVKGKDNIEIAFPNNVYRCNTSDLKKYYKEETEETIDEYKNNLKTMGNNLRNYFKFSLNEITVKTASTFYKEENRKKLINKIELYAKKYPIWDIESIRNKIKEPSLSTITIKFNKSMDDFNDIIDAEFDFIDIVKLNDTRKGYHRIIEAPEFNCKISAVTDKILYTEENNLKLKKLIDCFKGAINNYTGKAELEKKYQHQFMLSGKSFKSIFGTKGFIEPFEQEYPIKNKKGILKEKAGRIDAIFTRISGNVLEDIYMIELKVNDDVILGSNGVMTHLDDINSFMIDDTKNKDGETQKDTLLNNIVYRYKELNNKPSNFDFKKKEPRYHFYTVCGYTSEEKKDNVYKKIKKLFNINNDIISKTEKIDGNQISSKFTGQTINTVKPSNDICEVMFFFENNPWEVKEGIGSKFKSYFQDELKNE